jgi:formate--tetrahydrofolate ligase
MGAEKFFDIKCRVSGLRPDAAVVVLTVRSLKLHGGVGKIVAGQPLDPALLENDPAAISRGATNLVKHIENVRAFGVPPVVAINVFPTDTREEIAALREVALAAGAENAVESSHFVDGGKGAENLARAVWAAAEKGAAGFHLLYPDDAPLRHKIERSPPDLRRRRRRRFLLPTRRRATRRSGSGACRCVWRRPIQP